MAKIRVLFVCVYNSARSPMAAEWLNHLAGDRFDGESAGLEPTEINSLAVEVMKEIGVDMSGDRAHSVFDYFREGRRYNYIITVCDDASAEKCPIFPGVVERIHWSFPDPCITGSDTEKLEKTREVRDMIKPKVEEFMHLVESGKLKDNAPPEWRFEAKLS